MYEKQFQFRTRPFCCIPLAECYFPASSIDSALESTRLSIDRASGPAVIFGQSGWGKSLLLAVLQKEYQSRYRVVNVLACTRMSRRHDLLQNILYELGQPYRGMSEGELRLALIDYLKPSNLCPNGILLLVDDGYTLPYRLLDELRMITNFVREGQPRVRLVIAGTIALEEKLGHPHLESFNQRIAARCYLQAMRRDEVEAYIRHQIIRAGCPNPDVFQTSAIAAVTQLCDGNPRTINQICDHALILAASCGQSSVNGELIAEAFGDIQRLPASMWLASTETSTKATPETTDGNWAAIEFGKINDDTSNADQPAQISPDESAETESTTVDATSIDEQIDEFSAMVDSLADLFASGLNDESPATPSVVPYTDSTSTDATVQAIDPFQEPFAEEFSITDNYAELAARQNRRAMQITDQDVARLEKHLNEAAKDATVLLSSEISLAGDDRNDIGEVVSSSPSLIERLSPESSSTEFPIVDYQPYRSVDDDATEIPDRASADISDDRDMLVVSQLQKNLPTTAGSQPTNQAGISVTRGQAVRLDYARLFHQLRGDTSSSQSPNRE